MQIASPPNAAIGVDIQLLDTLALSIERFNVSYEKLIWIVSFNVGVILSIVLF